VHARAAASHRTTGEGAAPLPFTTPARNVVPSRPRRTDAGFPFRTDDAEKEPDVRSVLLIHSRPWSEAITIVSPAHRTAFTIFPAVLNGVVPRSVQ
jgi:hypothetical protein